MKLPDGLNKIIFFCFSFFESLKTIFKDHLNFFATLVFILFFSIREKKYLSFPYVYALILLKYFLFSLIYLLFLPNHQ